MFTYDKNSAPALKFFVPFQKYDDETGIVEGFATVEEIDKQGEIVRVGGAEKAFEKLSEAFSKATDGMSLGPLREMHTSSAAGKLTWWERCEKDGKGAIAIAGKVVDDMARTKCKERVYTGFSIGGNPIKSHIERIGNKRVNVIDEFDLMEVSLVDNPACPSATFTVVKRAEPVDNAITAVPAAKPKADPREKPRATFSALLKSLRKDGSFYATGYPTGGPNEGAQFEGASLGTAARVLSALVDAMCAEWYEAGGPPDDDTKSGIATLTAAAEQVLVFFHDELLEQLRSLTAKGGPIMDEAMKAITQLLTLRKSLTPAQWAKVASDPEMAANLDAMHKMGHALAKATYAMGATACKVTDPHGVEGDESAPADAADGNAASAATDGKPAPPAKPVAPAPTAAAPAAPAAPAVPPQKEKSADPSGWHDESPGTEQNNAGSTTVRTDPKNPIDTPGNSGVTMPSANSDVERPSSGQEDRVSGDKMAGTGTLVKALEDVLAVVKAMDVRVRKSEKAPAPIGRPVAAAEKTLPGATTVVSGDTNKAVIDRLHKMADEATDPRVKHALAMEAATLSVKAVHAERASA